MIMPALWPVVWWMLEIQMALIAFMYVVYWLDLPKGSRK